MLNTEEVPQGTGELRICLFGCTVVKEYASPYGR
jgi:hypothetical protein